MTDETIEPKNDEVENADLLLQIITSLANSGAAFPITLFSSGVIISGTLIGRREYMKRFTSDFTTGFSEETAATVKEAFGVNELPDNADKEAPADTVRYIHLAGAKIYTPGQQPIPNNSLLWRGKIADISGFSYGSFSTEH